MSNEKKIYVLNTMKFKLLKGRRQSSIPVAIRKLTDNMDRIPEDLQDSLKTVFNSIKTMQKVMNLDPLTGVYNTKIFNYIRDFDCVAFFDANKFKSINDSYGHKVGDDIIRIVGEILNGSFRQEDYVCRTGGDEFVVVFTRCNTPEGVAKVTEKLEAASLRITGEIEKILPQSNITFSIGLAERVRVGSVREDLDATINLADKAMYEAKSQGTTKVFINKI